MNVCEHGDHEAPDGERFCSKECNACEHTEFDQEEGTCANVCGLRPPTCVMCNGVMPVACTACTTYAFEAAGVPKGLPKGSTLIDELKEKLEELHKLRWWKNHGDDHTRAAMQKPLENGKQDFADWALKNLKGLREL